MAPRRTRSSSSSSRRHCHIATEESGRDQRRSMRKLAPSSSSACLEPVPLVGRRVLFWRGFWRYEGAWCREATGANRNQNPRTGARPPAAPRLADARRTLGEDRAAAPQAAPFGLSPPAGQRPGGDGRPLLSAADRLPVERPERDRHLLVVLGAPPLPGMYRGGGVPQALGDRKFESS